MRRLRDRCEKNPLSSDYESGDNLGHLQSSLNLPAKPVTSNGSAKETSNEAVYEVEQRYRGYLAKALEVLLFSDSKKIDIYLSVIW
ncbi:unnamed protein product [Hymenolepis diminuta]|uniref:E2F_TDP domain-containing protein n=1 Tax=Hymenolepis diminuta TaxID=6216 RepID=A0A0R3SNW9_HYMDI|nr:unnamed protein product [Hymenolepis diminuta]